MRPIRIALGQMPQLLRDIVVQTIGGEQDMTIVGEAATAAQVELLLSRQAADVLVLDVESGRSSAEESGRLLARHGDLKVLALSCDGRSAALHWLQPRQLDCADVSPDGLLRLIRSTCTERS